MRQETPRQQLRRRQQAALRRNPAMNHKPNDRRRVIKALTAIRDRAEFYLNKFEGQPIGALWPFKNVVHVGDEDYQADRYNILEGRGAFGSDNAIDPMTGHFPGFQDKAIKSSNVIDVITWYQGLDEYDDLREMLIIKPIYSPLPCKTWGRLPLTHSQWCMVAMPLILMRSLYQWTQAVQHYTGMEAMHYGGCGGWYRALSNKVKSHEQLAADGWFLNSEDDGEENQPWIGTIIFSDITEPFSIQQSGT